MAAKPKPAKKDKHKSGFMIRFPESFRGPLEELRRRNTRTMTLEAQRALLAYFQTEGVALPETTA
jgi:hypothetical protein